MGTWNIQKVHGHPELILQGNYNGLHILENLSGSWQYRNKISGFDISSRYFEQVNENNILVSHEYKGVYRLSLDTNYRSATGVIEDFSVAKGANSSLIRFKNEIYYGSENGIFKYNRSSLKFEKDKLLSTIYETDTYISGKLVADDNESLWAFTNKYIHHITEDPFGDNFQFEKISIPQSLRNEKKGFENITEVSANKYLFGTSNGYYLIDVSQIKDKPYLAHIDRVKNGSTRESIVDVSTLDDGLFKTNQNFISFDYSIPEYEKYMEAEYQYILEGVSDSNWSSWTTNTTTAYENLGFGDYIFKVNARVNNREVEIPAQYYFTIQKPWYASIVAIVLYVLLVGLFFMVVNQFYKRYYRNQRTRILEKTQRMNSLKDLELQKELMQLKNEKLNIDIEARNRELAVSTMSMIKKNNILNEFKEDLLKLNTDSNLNPLLKKIDNSINDKEDWKFFEEAFNHADKDFFKKVKALHPELTSNDLRLCVYLRLNLSSKEIAPLLNITHRSVEVKRYRLRKKMGLSHDISLTNYILEL
jgi:DNA-binding CsgD family transcriptional regulator